MMKNNKGPTLVAKLVDVPHKVFQFVGVLLFIWIFAQKVCTLQEMMFRSKQI